MPIKEADPEQNRVERSYDDNNNLIELLETDVSQIEGVHKEAFLATYYFDSLDRKQRQVDNLGQTQYLRYDSRNNLVAMADAHGPLTEVSITRRVFPDGSKTVNTINHPGNVVLLEYDGINRKVGEDQVLTGDGQGDGIIGVTLEGIRRNSHGLRNIPGVLNPDPSQSVDGLVTNLKDWDQNSLLTSLIDDNGNQTQYTYDNLNRPLTETKGISLAPALADRDDLDTTMTHEYDPDNNIVKRTDENGSMRECDFDGLSRRIACHITRASNVVGTTAESYEYDGLSRLTLTTDNNEPGHPGDDSLIKFTYDSLSRTVEESQQIGDLPAKVVSTAWLAENLRVGLTYPNERALAFNYDGLDRLNTVTDMDTPQAIADYDYIGRDRVAQRVYPINGTRMTYLNNARTIDVGYDGMRRPVQLRHIRGNNSLIVGFTHTYDRMNNKLDETKLHDGVNREVYNYDSLYRLTNFDRVSPGAILPLHSDWTLDGVGNWKQVDSETRRHSSFNELITRNETTLNHDDNGNQTNDGTLLFTWDYNNRLHFVTRKADGLVVAVYSYDATNRRIRKEVTNSGGQNETTIYYYDRSQVLEERDSADVVMQQYVYGNRIDEPLVIDRNLVDSHGETEAEDQRLFYHQNTLDSVYALTSNAGQIVEGYQYDAYGRQTVFAPGANNSVDFGWDDLTTIGGVSTVDNRYMFTGRRHDAESQLYYYRSRYMDAELGRFIGRDMIGIWLDPLNFGNGYAYVGNQPTTFADPYGWKAFKKCDAAVKSTKKCGVASFEVKWKKYARATVTNARLKLDVTIKFKKNATYDPCCCEYRQNVKTVAKITAGPGSPWSVDSSPLHDDDYSRSDDRDGNAVLSHAGFKTHDIPGIPTIDANDVLDYSFTAEQGVIDCCNKSEEVERKGPHTGTIKGKNPRTYGGVPKTL